MSSYNVAPNAPMDTRFQKFLEGVELWSVYSQNHEEALIKAILDRIGTENRWCCEAGAADGLFMSNTRLLVDDGWSALLVEPDEDDFRKLKEQFGDRADVHLRQGFLVSRPENAPEAKLDDLLDGVGAPRDLDVLSLDVDSSEYYLVLSLTKFKPRVLVVEYNSLAEPMFIPPLRGPGQAGHMAMRYVCEARGYDVVCRTPTNLICVRKELSHLLMDDAALPEKANSPEVVAGREAVAQSNGHGRFQVFAAGRWQDYYDGCTVEVLPEEQEMASAGQLPARSLKSEKRPVRIALAMSTPRIGYLDCFEQMLDLAHAAGISRFRGQGVYFTHSLSRAIQGALDYRDKETGQGFDYILTADYDTFATADDLKAMAETLAYHPEIDALAPLQAKRGGFLEVLAGWEGSRDLTADIVLIDQAHFGFTLFRREFFERLGKPWFRERADENGEWGEGRVDGDIGFWNNAKACGLAVALAPHIVIGHGDECVAWPVIVNGKIEKKYQHVNDWMAMKRAPEGVGVIAAQEGVSA